MKTYKPNYKDGSIVNLISSVKKSFGVKSKYGLLKNFNVSNIADKNVILIVIDGLGYEFLKRYGKNSFLHKNLKGKMTSVFPATTSVALTALSTGVPAQQHGFTGWFMYLKEIGTTSAVLPFHARAGSTPLNEKKIGFRNIFEQKSIFTDLNTDSYYILHKNFSKSGYSRASYEGAKMLSFSNLDGFFRQIKKIASNNSRHFVFAYWDKLDWSCHIKGTGSRYTVNHFKELDKKIESLAKTLGDKNTTIIVTADHGLIDRKGKNKIVDLKNHPKLSACLSLPLAGDSRCAYCYVRPNKVKEFKDYIKSNLDHSCRLYKSESLIKKNYFGLFSPHKKLADRIGDFTLLMKEDYIIKDSVLGEERHEFVGHHSGMSKEEMIVPLIII